MKRRAYLAGVGTAAVAGCTSTTDPITGSEDPIDCADGAEPSPDGYVDSTGEWPSIYYDPQNTGYAPERDGPGGCVDAQWEWHYPADDMGLGRGMSVSPIVDGDAVYVADESPYYGDDSEGTPDNNSLIALDAETGRERWRLDAGFEADSTPVLHDGTLYLPGNGELAAIDVAAREVLWSREMVRDSSDADQETFQPPVATDDGFLYVGGLTAELFALDAETGETVWRFVPEGMDPERVGEESAKRVRESKVEGEFAEPLAVAGDTVYAATFGDAVHAVDRHSGDLRWTYRLPLITPYDRPLAPVVSDGEVYVGTRAGLLYVLDVSTGERRWEYTEKQFGIGMSPGVDDARVYVTAGESVPETRLHAIDRETHEVEWETPVGRVTTGPAIDRENVYVEQGGGFLALDTETGDERWRFDMGGSRSAPAIANGAIYTANGSGHVFGLW